MGVFCFIGGLIMKIDLLKRKVEAEVDIRPTAGPYKIYSFAMSIINNPKIARLIALDYYPKTRVTRAQSRYNHYNRTKA
jgi:hypothetical protein